MSPNKKKALKKKKKKTKDSLFPLKRLGYHMSQFQTGGTVADLVRFAKFQLSLKCGVLMKDPIWDEYTQEELLIEYFAHKFVVDKELRESFELTEGMNQGMVDEFANWADGQMKKNKNESAQLNDAKPVSFSPDVMGDEEE